MCVCAYASLCIYYRTKNCFILYFCIHASSLVVLLDLLGLPVESNLPYRLKSLLSVSTFRFESEDDVFKLFNFEVVASGGLSVICFFMITARGAGLIGCSIYLRSKSKI